jgi:exportin-2 (importin alpha re-exporter)
MYVRSAVPAMGVHFFNDVFVLEGAMRVIVTARQTLTPGYERTLQRLVGILGVISKNPSNPNFDQFIFESISALMRYELFCRR